MRTDGKGGVESRMSGADQLRLTRAILLYEAGSGYYGGWGTSGGALATIHEVMTAGKGAPVILPGRCLDRATLTDMARKLQGLETRREVLPANVLVLDGAMMAWHVPSQARPIFFATRDKGFNAAVGGRVVIHPPLLFVATPGHLRVLALASDARPTADTAVFRAPYYNLYAAPQFPDGTMCAGNVRLPETLGVADIPAWETAFWQTNFTHTNLHGERLTLHPRRHGGLWWEMARIAERWQQRAPAAGYQPRVHQRYLVPLGKSVGEVISG